MFDDASPSAPKVPLDESAAEAVQRLGRWMRVVGTIQLAFAGLVLIMLMMTFVCGFALAMSAGGIVLLVTLIYLVAVSVFLLQSLRIQAAGEQFKNLAEEHDVDYLELAFVRLKTVYIIDIVIGVLMLIGSIGGAV